MAEVDEKNKVKEILHNPNTQVSDVVNNSSVMESFNPQNPDATGYFIHHISEILGICLSDQNKELSSNVFLLFPKINSSLIDGNDFNGYLLIKSNEFLSSGIKDDFVFSRFFSIILYSVLNFPKNCGVITPLLISIIDFMEKPGCFEMFQSICEKDSPASEMQKNLMESDFIIKVLEKMRRSDDNETVSMILKLIGMCGDNPKMDDYIRNPDICRVVLEYINYDDLYLKAQFWKCITSLTSKKTVCVVKGILDAALSNLSDCYVNVEMYRIYSFEFIGKLLFFCPEIVDELIEKQINEIVLKVICQFGNCTHLILAVFNYIRVSFGIEKMRDWNYKVFVPFMVATVKSSERTSATAASYRLLCDLYKMSQSNKEVKKRLLSIRHFKEFIDTFLVPYIKVTESHYGGPINRKQVEYLFID